MESITILDKDYVLKVGDVIEVALSWDPIIPDDEDDTMDASDYDNKCWVSYRYPDGAGVTNVEFVEEDGFLSFSDIEDYLKENLDRDISEIDDFDLLDVNAKSTFQTAKIKVKSVKEI